MNGRVKIHGAEYPLGKVFSDEFVFSIPPYQRPYAWTTEHAQALLDDICTAMGNDDEPVDQLSPYFLGSIVLIKGDSPEAQVVDGQQRLTTLTILLASIRALVESPFSDGLTSFLYERGNPVWGNPNRYRLTLRERDAEFFRQYIQEDEGIDNLEALQQILSDSRRNIRENALFFLSRLQSLPELQRQRLAKFLIQGCYLVVVSTPDLDSAYRIFSILNDRGLDLSLTDILKAEILGKIQSVQQEAYTEKWEDVEEQLGRGPFEALFAHIRMIALKAKPRASVLRELREQVRPTDEPTRFIDDVLLPRAEAFYDILTANYESIRGAEEINRLFGWLQQIDNTDWLPPAILYVSRYRNQPEELTGFLRDLERLAAGLMILRADVNQRIERYGRLLSMIERGEDLCVDTSPLQLTSEECRRIIEALRGDIYNAVKIRVPVLLRLDAALSTGEATYQRQVLSVEHVLPQHPAAGSQWIAWFPDEEYRSQVVHRLGNLVLLTRRKNSQAQNYEFDRKKKEYFSRNGVCASALTTQVLQEAEWTPSVMERRQPELIDMLKQVWRL